MSEEGVVGRVSWPFHRDEIDAKCQLIHSVGESAVASRLIVSSGKVPNRGVKLVYVNGRRWDLPADGIGQGNAELEHGHALLERPAEPPA